MESVQTVELDTALVRLADTLEVEKFVRGKVFWLGFRLGDKNTQVWIADTWDVLYVSAKEKTLIQCAQVLEARKEVVLDETQEYASAGDELLRQSHSWETADAQLESGLSPRGPHNVIHQWDLFICHASEDKESFVRPLASSLQGKGLKVWYDELTLKIGDSLRESIDKGLSSSRFGLVVLSPAFFDKHWTRKELDGLAAREVKDKKVILPVWHNVSYEDVLKYSPMLADRLAVLSSKGIHAVVEEILRAMGD